MIAPGSASLVHCSRAKGQSEANWRRSFVSGARRSRCFWWKTRDSCAPGRSWLWRQPTRGSQAGGQVSEAHNEATRSHFLESVPGLTTLLQAREKGIATGTLAMPEDPRACRGSGPASRSGARGFRPPGPRCFPGPCWPRTSPL
jgi:hypothetical protein